MADDDALPSRPGSYLDLARRMDKIEQRHETLENEVRALSSTVARVETNQQHAVELNKLRFDALDTGLKSVGGQLSDFIKRIDALITGEVETPQMRDGRELVKDFQTWRGTVEQRFAGQDAIKADNLRRAQRMAGWAAIVGSIIGSVVATATELLVRIHA